MREGVEHRFARHRPCRLVLQQRLDRRQHAHADARDDLAKQPAQQPLAKNHLLAARAGQLLHRVPLVHLQATQRATHRLDALRRRLETDLIGRQLARHQRQRARPQLVQKAILELTMAAALIHRRLHRTSDAAAVHSDRRTKR